MVNLRIYELTTGEIVKKLERQELDIGLLELPLYKPSFKEAFCFTKTLYYDRNATLAGEIF